jgi:hypothetical protein
MRFSDRKFAGEEKAKIERALGPGGPQRHPRSASKLPPPMRTCRRTNW